MSLRASLPSRALGIAIIVIFCIGPLMSGCTGKKLLERYGKSVVKHALDNPLDAFDSGKGQIAKRQAIDTMRDRGIFLLLVAVPLSAAAITLVPRKRFPRVPTIAGLFGAAALGSFITNLGMGVANWDPGNDPGVISEEQRVLLWILWALPSGIPIFLLPFAIFGVARKRWWAQRTATIMATLALVGVSVELFSDRHYVQWGGWSMALCIAVILFREAEHLPVEVDEAQDREPSQRLMRVSGEPVV